MRSLLTVLSALLLIAGVAAADECQEASPEVDTGETPLGQYYVDNDMCQPSCLFSVWIYEESNGQPGLQRGDEICTDECCNQETDTIIF